MLLALDGLESLVEGNEKERAGLRARGGQGRHVLLETSLENLLEEKDQRGAALPAPVFGSGSLTRSDSVGA